MTARTGVRSKVTVKPAAPKDKVAVPKETVKKIRFAVAVDVNGDYMVYGASERKKPVSNDRMIDEIECNLDDTRAWLTFVEAEIPVPDPAPTITLKVS